jgi:hypothetical protein
VNGPPFASLKGKRDDVKGGRAEAEAMATATAKAHRPTAACATLREGVVRARFKEARASVRSENWLPQLRRAARKSAFSVSIRNESGVCFDGVTAISNRIQCRLEIAVEGGVKPVGMRPAPRDLLARDMRVQRWASI